LSGGQEAYRLSPAKRSFFVEISRLSNVLMPCGFTTADLV
jgi:hypothetical protein